MIDLQRVSRHEASHVVTGWALGYEIAWTRAEDREGLTWSAADLDEMPPLDAAALCAAGPVWDDLSGQEPIPAERNIDLINVVKVLGESAADHWPAIWNETSTLLVAQADLVFSLGQLLAVRRYLSTDDLAEWFTEYDQDRNR